MSFSMSSYSSFKNRNRIMKSTQCGCYHCIRTFAPDQIIEWWDVDRLGIGQTAVCPYCGVDSVIGDIETQITKELLFDMREYWFSITCRDEPEKPIKRITLVVD